MRHSSHQHPFVARWVRRMALPILALWVGIAICSNVVAPQLEVVGAQHSVGMNASDAPSTKAMSRIGEVFDEFDSDTSATIVIEGEEPLGDEAHHFYDDLIQRLERDTTHVEHVQDFWGDPLTAGAAQSKDGKAAYVQIYLVGNQGEARSTESVDAVRKAVEAKPPPARTHVFVTGAAPLLADQNTAGSSSTAKVTIATFLVIMAMLLLVYRSVPTVVLVLGMVMLEVSAARGVVAVLGDTGIIGLSTYSTNLLTLLSIAAGTDYVIFVLGRYHEARNAGEDQRASYFRMFASTIPVITGSGLTVAGTVYCLRFARLPSFQTLGVPASLGVLVTLLAAVTLAPAAVVLGSRFGLFEPRRKTSHRRWRRVGTAVVRWPGLVLTGALALAAVGLLALPGYTTSYDARPYMPSDTPANAGYAAAERHFSVARLNPELLMVETDHDMRNPADMLLLERIARTVLHAPGVALVQSITRPLGTVLPHTSIPSLLSSQSAGQILDFSYQDARARDLLTQAEEIDKTVGVLRQQFSLQQQSNRVAHEQAEAFRDTLVVVRDLRDKIANFDDFFRPIRSYFCYEPHCFDIPACAALRSVFDAIDGISALTDQFGSISSSFDDLEKVQAQLTSLLPPQIDSQQINRELTLSNYGTTSGRNAQSEESSRNATALGKAFDDAKIDDTFYLGPEVFDNPDFQRGLKSFMSKDGKAARMIITHEGEPATPQGIEHVDAIREAAFDAVKATPLADAKFYIAGTAAMYKDIRDGAAIDLVIAATAALGLIMLIMLVLTRSLIAAITIVGTVALSLGASFGMSVLIWQDLLGLPLYWIVLALAVILLLAVGADYNLLLVSRLREELHAGINTGIIRAMAGTGSIVTSAGLVFAATMSTFAVSDLRVLGQIGTTIGLGLLFDTLVVRALMTPAIAALLGRWFWWPQNVRSRPARLPGSRGAASTP